MIRIYQVNKANFREWGFMRYEWFKDHGHKKMNRDMYDLVWEGETEADGLEDVFEQFNLHRPDDFEGHSLSVSDLVERDDGLYFVDSIGFKPVEWEEA